MIRMRAFYLALAVLTPIAAMAPAQGARGVWTKPALLTPARNRTPAGAPQVVLNDSNTALAVWPQGNQLIARPRSSHAWQAASVIVSSTQQVTLLDVAAGLGNDAVVVFAAVPPGGGAAVAQAAFYTRGAWTPSLPIPATAGTSVLNARARFDGANNATLVWVEKSATACTVMALVGSADSGWGTPVSIGTGCYPFIRLAVNNAGEAVLGLGAPSLVRHGGSPWVLASRNGAGVWTPLTNIGTGTYATPPAVAISDNGAALAVFSDADLGVQWSRRARVDGSWSAPAILDGGVPAVPVEVAIDARGNAAAVYNSYYTVVPPAGLVGATLRNGSNQWSAPTAVTGSASTIDNFQLGATPAGSFLAGWADSTPGAVAGADGTIGVSVLPRGANAWVNTTLAADLSGNAASPSPFTTTVGAARGHAIAVWNAYDANYTAIDKIEVSSVAIP